MSNLEYWLQWQVPVCAFILTAPSIIAVNLMKRVDKKNMVKSSDLWVPCWRNLNPIWLLFYRAFAFVSMVVLLYQTVASFGPFVFLFYTQWTFTLVIVYFALGTVISARGCWKYSRNSFPQNGEREKILKNDSEDVKSQSSSTLEGKTKNSKGYHDYVKIDEQAGFWENVMQSVYQTCAGASVLTDIVFWCLLLPFMTGENFKLTLLIGLMHSVNAVFLVLDSALNRLTFPWHRLTYFVLWSSVYVAFHWVLHALGSRWWPYPFLDISTPWAPLWYFGLALVHIPCYGLYALLLKAKGSLFSKLFPHAFVRVSVEKKQT